MRTISLTFCLLISFSGPSFAQFNAETLLDNHPVRIGAGLEVQFTRFGQNVLVTASSFATVHGAQAIADASIPAINKRLACAKGRKYGVAITSLTFVQNVGLGRSSELGVTANAHVTSCGLGLVDGDVAVSSSISPLIRNSTIQLAVSESDVQSLGVRWIGLSIPDSWVAWAGELLLTSGVSVDSRAIDNQLKVFESHERGLLATWETRDSLICVPRLRSEDCDPETAVSSS
jgi:hypothetical protein